MKKYYSAIWICTLLVAWGIIPAISAPKVYAADPQDLSNTTTDIKANEQQNLPVPDREEVQTSTYSVLMEQVGGWTGLTVAGHRLGVRIGFVNGGFDQYALTHKAEPVVQLKDLDKDLTYPYVRAGKKQDLHRRKAQYQRGVQQTKDHYSKQPASSGADSDPILRVAKEMGGIGFKVLCKPSWAEDLSDLANHMGWEGVAVWLCRHGRDSAILHHKLPSGVRRTV
ncbi:MAG TPA: hypothetical protein PLG20_09105 [Candidatus Syntrophosphaera sp.]|nr:hypothetical protein [Candidatus Syntrophosphaera sp.]